VQKEIQAGHNYILLLSLLSKKEEEEKEEIVNTVVKSMHLSP
jgi:mannose/fructose-specific phosphotransferase system component IIA